ncbi:MAG TPA: hypothetical protein VMV86_00700 [Methanosarcinales archaeon]|nr:hypothetical protein [Methanosarcinales archaeon]
MSEKIGENKCSICGMPIEPHSVSGGLCYQCKKLEKKKAMTTADFLKYYDVDEPINYVCNDKNNYYKYGAIDILSDAKEMLEKRDNRIKELEEILSGDNLEKIIDCVKTHGQQLLIGMVVPKILDEESSINNPDEWKKKKQEAIQKALEEYAELIKKLKALENKQ